LGENFMARKAEATLWMKVKIGGRLAMKRLVKQGRGYVPRIEGPYERGCYYLRYTKSGKRIWESIGNDLTLALQEQRARQSSLETPEASPTAGAAVPQLLRGVAGEFLAAKPKENWRHIVNTFGEWWGWAKSPADFQRHDFKAFAKHVGTLGLRPRGEHNYLNQICTFLRATGRVVVVAKTEQDATLKRAMAFVPNTLILVASDFPTVNRGTPDYYSDEQIDSLFSHTTNLWERAMLACFYYTGMREAEVSHL
jgi:hypothetical protein